MPYYTKKECYRAQVENLVVNILPLHQRDITYQLVTLLPLLTNLKLLYIGGVSLTRTGGELITPDSSNSGLFSSLNEWGRKIEQLIICPRMVFASKLFRNIMFPCLKVLKISGPFPQTSEVERALFCWPTISELYIADFNLTIGFLEQVHKTLPAITSLTFKNAVLGNSQMAEKIKPANSMTSFCVLFQSRFTDTWIRYISQKYPKLVHLSFSRYHENGLKTNYSESMNLTVLDSFFHHCGSRLKELNFLLDKLPVGLFDCLDIHNVKLDDLNIISSSLTQMKNSFINSMQFTFIKTLTLWGALSEENYKTISIMPLLHDLTIVLLHNSNPVSEFTEDILQGCPPSLTSLGLDSCILMSCTFDTIGPIYRQNSIQRLVLSNIVFYKGVDTTLSRYVVNTQVLVLKNCDFYGGKFHTPSFKLDCLEVYQEITDGEGCISVHTIAGNKSEQYSSCYSQSPVVSRSNYEYPDTFSFFPSTKRLNDTHDHSSAPFLTMSCWSVNKVDLCLSNRFQ